MNRSRTSATSSLWLACALLSVAAHAQENSAPVAPATSAEAIPAPATDRTAAPGQPTPPVNADPAAQLYMLKCAGCHTVGGGQLTGPDLRPIQTWPRQNVDPAIQRMEKNVGPLKPEEIAQLGDLLQAADAAGRLADERKRIALTEMAKLEPANAQAGEAIFFGRKPLTNRGLSCASCHAMNGSGGNLASDLVGSFAKLGEVPLMSSIEGVTFPLMKAAYADNTITKQETVHLVKYLETAANQPGGPKRVPPLHAIGTVGAAVSLLGLTQHFRKRNRGVRMALVRDAMRRSRS